MDSTASGPPLAGRRHDVYLNETRKALQLVGDATTAIRLFKGRLVHAAEVPAVAGFDPAGALLLPVPPGGGPVEGLAVIAEALRYLAVNPDERLLVAGHGGDEDLARARAASTLAVLRGDRTAWVELATTRGTGAECQHLLGWAAATFGWPCDPGARDGVLGPATRRALHAFRWEFNTSRGTTLAVNAPLGADDWRAFFECYDAELERRLAEDAAGLASMRAAVRVVEPTAVGCAAEWPVSRVRLDGLPATADARVDLLAFDPADVPGLSCHAGPACAPKTCDVYRKGKYRAAPLSVAPPEPKVRLRLGLRDVDDAPIAARPCELQLAGAASLTLTTGPDGLLELQVPESAQELTLRLVDPEAPAAVLVPVRLHPLAPVGERRGQQERLRNLGYFLGDLDGEDQLDEDAPDAFRSAVEEFQCDQGLAVSGVCDDATQARLVQVHGG